jgi:aarF domain-containing kinase
MEFSKVPLASASLAQVHAARTFTGEKVAVKVQHMHLTDSALADIVTLTFVVSFVHWLFPFFPSFDYRYSYTSAYACDLCSICFVYRQIVFCIQLF